MFGAHLLVFLFDAVLPALRPLELGGEDRETGRDNEKGRAGKHEQGDSSEQDNPPDNADQNFFGVRFQLTAICSKVFRTPRARALIVS